MTIVQPITTINLEGTTLNVDDLSAQVKALVNVYNDWNQKLSDAQSNTAMVQAALNDLSRQIIQQIKNDQDAAAQKVSDTSSTTDGSTADPA